ncbi:MAG: alkaline phosphatase family protein [Longimicrobiales bacterium]
MTKRKAGGRKLASIGLVAVLACANTALTQGSPETVTDPGSQTTPAVIVLLVVDQLPADLLDRYADLFQGGFARLRAEGRRFTQATHDHGITETSPGHATISTGTFPSRHGMVSNIWYSREDPGPWQPTENVIDPDYVMVGAEGYVGSSPSALMRSSIGDWLVEKDDDAKVVSISGKDRAAILLAGQGEGTVYWFESALGRFATSTFYDDKDPGWVEDFNEDLQERISEETLWLNQVPEPTRQRARPDSAAYERDGEDTTFPHVFVPGAEQDVAAFYHWWSNTPYLDRETFAMAGEALQALDLGQDDVTDLLAVSLSATDRVGHDFGPFSQEQLDNLLRLDVELGQFLDLLDRRFGDRYVLVVTSDHGVSPAPEYVRELGGTGRRLTRDAGAQLNEAASGVLNGPEAGGATMARELAAVAADADWVARAWAHVDLREPAEGDTLAALVARSVYPGRAAGLMGRLGVEVVLNEHTLLWAWPYGTTHGSPFLYDRQVPLIFLGAGVAPGVVAGQASTTSIAPTLAVWAGVQAPNDLDGGVLPLR